MLVPGFLMATFPSSLRLKEQTPLARGTHQALYDVKGHPELIVKVLQNNRAVRSPGKRLKGVLRRYCPAVRDRSLKREYVEYIRLKRRQIEGPDAFPAANFFGLVATDVGLGKVFEKIQGPDGRPGPTVGALGEDGRLPDYLPLLNDFARRLFAWEVRANDVNRGNIVLGLRSGREQFVLVDGLGDSHAIPVRTWSRTWNERSLHKRLAKVAARTRLVWHPAERRFSLGH